VPAVAKPAIPGQVLDVVEDRAETLIRVNQAHFADAGRVEEQPSARQQDELAMAGGVTPPGIRRADVLGCHPLLAQQGIHQVDLPTPDEPISTQVSPGLM
jgi:hypothetical protein